MRLRNHEIHQRINSNLKIEFAKQDITSFSGLELFKRYLRLIGLNSRIRRAFHKHHFRGDYSVIDYISVFIALWLTGGRRLRHVGYIKADPLVKRFCGLKSLPSDRSMSRWLGQFTNDTLQSLVTLNSEILVEKLKELKLSRITLDFDGTVLSCGNRVGWAFRGYNPFQRFSKSYYPLLCHIAQTGQILQVRNRPGNRHDSKGGALRVIQNCIEQVREEFGRIAVEIRLDAAFFTKEIVNYLENSGVEYAVKVPMWRRLEIKPIINRCHYWHHAAPYLSWIKRKIHIERWHKDVEVIIYRQKISEKRGVKPHQLDLFAPDDGIYEYSVLFTNKTITPKNILDFYNGRCAMEHNIAELKNEFGFDSIPTKHYQGNSAYQQISVLAYNLIRNYQLDSGLAEKRKSTAKKTNIFYFDSLRTIRFESIVVAGRLLKTNTLRLAQNVVRQQTFSRIQTALDRKSA